MRGLFITFEGPDGCGKSTTAEAIYEKLKNEYDIIRTREPGGTAISEKIRSLILDNANSNMSYRTEALLYAASRAQHLEEKIIPAVNSGKIVLCERFVLSSIAYQGYGRGIGVKDIEIINNFATGGFEPDITFLFDTKGKSTLERKLLDNPDRLENSGEDFHLKVRQAYKKLAENPKYTVIDASRSEKEVFLECLEILYKRLEVVR
ncbi:dTMP kinase [Peptoniphilus catoniae]|uniref:dTMP kinase n=1 Tax=Peptoniphilus catoniae TaxID=1660341 RepID=UPI0010FD7128|nr:dTMP kinase [Peptoniphilus catoniae]